MARRTGTSALFGGRGAWLLAALLALLAAPCPAPAQGTVSVLPVQGLRFGMLSTGMPTVISPLDAGRRATVELVGSGHVTLLLELPQGLRAGGDGGPLLPLRFGATDGRVTFPGSGTVLVFDPAAPVSFTLPQGGATIWLGGSAEPASAQPPGAYDAAITVHVVVANPAT
jgi:hypothetical protein